MNLFRKKSIDKIVQDAATGVSDGHSASGLKKVLGVRDLTFMGIAAVVGAGIFSTIGTAAHNGGPGISILFVITAITCGFSALCYAEFASRVPIAGSAYTYAYVSFGELIAWIIGWALILEYAIGNIVVAISWSGYFVNLLEGFHIHLPGWLSTNYDQAQQGFEEATKHLSEGKTPETFSKLARIGYDAITNAPMIGNWKIILNVPALIIVVLITMLVYRGIKESKKSTNAMVIFKICIIIGVIILGAFYVDTTNWSPFMPNGFKGVLAGVSAVFYAYIGFDAISTTAEECKNPQRDLPRGMIYSLIICTVLYILIALVLTGMVNYKELAVADPLAFVFERIGMHKIGYIISISAVVATTSVLLVFQLGQPRIWMSMSRDGLLPKKFSNVHPKFGTPAFATIVTGIFVGIPSLFMSISSMTDLTSIGTLFAFVLVCFGVLALPRMKLDGSKKQAFRLPYINGRFIIPILASLFIYFSIVRILTAFNLSYDAIISLRIIIYNFFTSFKLEDYFDVLYLISFFFLILVTIIGIVTKFSILNFLNNKIGRIVFPVLIFILTYVSWNKIMHSYYSVTNHLSDISKINKPHTTLLSQSFQEILFLVFVFILVLVAIFSFLRKFSTIPIIGAMCCLYLMIEIPPVSWLWFFIWMGIGLVFYALYGSKKSKLNESNT